MASSDRVKQVASETSRVSSASGHSGHKFFFFLMCAILVNRSMITQSWSQPSESSNSVMKSIAIDCQGVYGSSSSEIRL